MSWSTHSYEMGKYQTIEAILAGITHELQLHGNGTEGWAVYLCRRGTNVGVQVSPLFHPNFGDTRRHCIAACKRAYGIEPHIVR